MDRGLRGLMGRGYPGVYTSELEARGLCQLLGLLTAKFDMAVLKNQHET